MASRRSWHLTVRTRITLVALVLALAPLLFVSALSLSTLDRARSIAVQTASEALREQTESDLARWVTDKANLYDAKLDRIYHQVETIVTYRPGNFSNPTVASERVWIAPDGPTPSCVAFPRRNGDACPSVHPAPARFGRAGWHGEPGVCRV
jgi:two-component system sensor histidine kinase/response regulator